MSAQCAYRSRVQHACWKVAQRCNNSPFPGDNGKKKRDPHQAYEVFTCSLCEIIWSIKALWMFLLLLIFKWNTHCTVVKLIWMRDFPWSCHEYFFCLLHTFLWLCVCTVIGINVNCSQYLSNNFPFVESSLSSTWASTYQKIHVQLQRIFFLPLRLFQVNLKLNRNLNFFTILIINYWGKFIWTLEFCMEYSAETSVGLKSILISKCTSTQSIAKIW